MRAEFTKFGKTRLVPVVTYTGGKEDKVAKTTWDKEVWMEREEDYIAFNNKNWAKGVVRVVTPGMWIRGVDV